MKRLLVALAAIGLGSAGHAAIPTLNAICPGDIELHVDQGGYAYINGNEAKVTMYNSSTLDAAYGETTVSVMINPDGTATVMYTGPGGANGICEAKVVDDSMFECPSDVSEADRSNYPGCN